MRPAPTGHETRHATGWSSSATPSGRWPVGHGLSSAEIAAAAYLSTATVKAYVSRLLVKLRVSNRVQVALLVQQVDVDGPATD